MGFSHDRLDLPFAAGVGEAMSRAQLAPSIPPLTSFTADGERYERPPKVQAEIREMLSLPQSQWIAKAKAVKTETLVFLIRQTHGPADALCGQLLEELRERISLQLAGFVRKLNEAAAEDVVMGIEMEILESVLTEEPSRKRDFLEIAFGQALQRLAIDAMRHRKYSVEGHAVPIVEEYVDESGEDIGHPIEFIAADQPNPEEAMLELEARKKLWRFLRKALKAVKNPRHRKAIVLHCARGWAVDSSVRGAPCLTRKFRATSGEVHYWIKTGLQQMRDALGIKVDEETPSRGRKTRRNRSRYFDFE